MSAMTPDPSPEFVEAARRFCLDNGLSWGAVLYRKVRERLPALLESIAQDAARKAAESERAAIVEWLADRKHPNADVRLAWRSAAMRIEHRAGGGA